MKRSQLIKNTIISGFRKNMLLALLVLSCLVLNILLSLQTVSSGPKLSSLESTQKELLKQNKDITLELVQATSLTSANKVASSLGYIVPNNLVYVKESEVVASRL